LSKYTQIFITQGKNMTLKNSTQCLIFHSILHTRTGKRKSRFRYLTIWHERRYQSLFPVVSKLPFICPVTIQNCIQYYYLIILTFLSLYDWEVYYTTDVSQEGCQDQWSLLCWGLPSISMRCLRYSIRNT
jgi:hypothetical protein